MTEIEKSRTRERESLLAHISKLLESDSRVLAVWLEGSLGRGAFDGWSDLDIWCVVRDEDFPDFITQRYGLMAEMGRLALTVEAPQNGPSDGVYLMGGFDCPTGLQLVDWYCQPASAACRPQSNAILFVRPELSNTSDWKASIPEEGISLIFRRFRRGDDTLRGDQPHIAWHPTPEEDAKNAGYLAWAMVAIQAKTILRDPTASGLQFENFIAKLVKKASMGQQTLRPSYIDMALPREKIDRLVDISGGLIRAIPTDVCLKDSIIRLLNSVRQSLPDDEIVGADASNSAK